MRGIKPYFNEILTSLVAIVLLIAIFYGSDLRSRTENLTYDLSVRTAPTKKVTGNVVLKEDENIEENLPQVLQEVLKSKFEYFALIAHPKAFNLASQIGQDYLKLMTKDQRFLLGVSTPIPELPASLKNQVFLFEFPREFRRNIIRSIPFAQQTDGYVHGVIKLSNREDYPKVMFIDYSPLPHMKPQTLPSDLNGKTIIYGTSKVYHWTSKVREGTYINTPWQYEGEDVAQGITLTRLLAIATEQAKLGRWISEAPLYINVVHVITLSIFCLLAWRLSLPVATSLILGGSMILIILHGIILSRFLIIIPLADTFFFGIIATIIGGAIRLKQELRKHTEDSIRLSEWTLLTQEQETFFERFSNELEQINQKTLASLRDLDAEKNSYSHQTLVSGEELSDYLKSMGQVNKLFKHDKLSFKKVNIRDCVNQTLKFFSARIAEKGLKIEFNLDESIEVHSDPILLVQILHNILSNAVKYSPHHGKVVISGEKNSSLNLLISDSGPGIPEAERERIFDKFYRIEDDRMSHAKGHGLGLYLSRYFAEKLGIIISVQNRAETGTTFVLSIPRRRRLWP